MLTVGQLKELIKYLPDDALVLQDDPFSEFSFDIDSAEKGFTKIDHITNDGEVYYESWIEDNFKELINDNPEDEEEIKRSYKPSLLLYLNNN